MNLNSSIEIGAGKDEAIQSEAQPTDCVFGAPASLGAVVDGNLG
jgi:hypothetical protein